MELKDREVLEAVGCHACLLLTPFFSFELAVSHVQRTGFPRSAWFYLKISINQRNYYLTLTLEERKFQ